MTGQAHGKAFGRELTRAMSEPWDGKRITGRGTAAGENVYINLATACSPVRPATTAIKGIAIEADSHNTGSIYLSGQEGEDANPAAGDQGWELSAGQSISLAQDQLGKCDVFIPTTGDRVRYCAIAAANSVEP